MKPLALIACHHAAFGAVLGHLPQWQKFTEPFLTFSDAIPAQVITEAICHLVGPAGHVGPDSIKRVKAILALAEFVAAARLNPHVLIGEYDAVPFRSVPTDIPPIGVVSAPLHPNGSPRFSEPFYPHVFWRMHVSTLSMLNLAAKGFPNDAEDSMGDRWFAALCTKAGVRLENDPLTYSRNSLDLPEYVQGAIECIKGGGWACHGIKTSEVFDALLSAAT